MLDASVEEVPVERPLELSAVVGLDTLGLEGELGEHVVEELDRCLSVVAVVDSQHPKSGAVVSLVQSSIAVYW